MIDLLGLVTIVASVLMAYYSIRLTRLFRVKGLEDCWKPMILVPFFMAGVVLLEVFQVQVLRARALMFLLALITILVSLHRFYGFWQRLFSKS
jgi:hypothetical protein